MTTALIDTGMLDILFMGMFGLLFVNTVLFVIIWKKMSFINEFVGLISEYLLSLKK